MNLYDLVQRVYSTTERNPNTTEYKNQIIGYINDAYLALCAEADWLFLHKRAEIRVYPDYTTGNCTVTNGSGTVTGAGTSWGEHMDGHNFIGPDGRTYVIGHVSSTTTLYLTEAYRGAGAGNAAYTIRFFGYSFPGDCEEPLSQVSRDDDFGRIRYVDSETEADLYFDRDETGDPYLYFPDTTYNQRVLDVTPTAADGVAPPAGSLISGTTYGYRITVTQKGVEGGPTSEVTFTATATGKIVLSAIQNLQVMGISVGYYKTVYRRTGSAPFYYLSELVDTATTFTDDGSITANINEPLEEKGPVLKVWFYPRPDIEKDIEVWYKRRVRRMQKDNDTPDIPPEFHEILWRLASAEVINKDSGDPAVHLKAADNAKKMMKKKYLNRTENRGAMANSWECRRGYVGYNLTGMASGV